MSEFKTFNAVVKEWLYKYFEKYPEKRNVIIEQLDQKEDVVDMMAPLLAISDIMCSVIEQVMEEAKVFLEQVMEEAKLDDIPFFGEFSEGVFK